MNTSDPDANLLATVLIVDDDPGARLLLGTALELAGFRVTFAADGAGAPLVDAIIAMAKSLGLATVAEGAETEGQWQYLRNRDANQVQGFLFCRPLAIADLERWHTDWLHSNQLRAAGGG